MKDEIKKRLEFLSNKILEKASDLMYLPTYEQFPKENIAYDQIIQLCINRYHFHKLLEFEEEQGSVDYSRIRSLSFDFSVPIKINGHDQILINSDQSSFYSLLIICSKSKDFEHYFVERETKLFYYRLTINNVKIQSINDYFWSECNMKKCEVENALNENSTISVDFPIVIEDLDDFNLNIENGKVQLSLEHVYKILTKSYQKIIRNKIHHMKYKNIDVINSLFSEFVDTVIPKEEPILKREEYEMQIQRSAPPCIHRIFDSLKKSAYLTVKGRFTLCMFLKGLGFTYFDQFILWKKHFCVDRNVNTFEKQLVPSLRQLYGLGTQIRDYNAHSCISIIGQDNPETVYQIQGCPFRYMFPSELKHYFTKMGRCVSPSDFDSIQSQLPDHPQIACKLFFDCTHNYYPISSPGISYPIQYFIESEKRIKLKESCLKS